VTRTGAHRRQRCRLGRTTDPRGPPGRGGGAGGARTAAVNGEAARGRRRFNKRLHLVSLAGNSGLRLLLHIEGETVVRFTGLVDDDSGQWWAATWSRAAGESEAEQRTRGR
jgi:hypothetical protein